MTKKVVETDKDLRFEVPLYTLAEAAHAVDVPPSTFATWAKGYTRRRPGQKATQGRPVITAFEARPGQPSVPFVGLAESMILAAVRRAGVPLQRIRPALTALEKEIGFQHALASKALYTDGALARLRQIVPRAITPSSGAVPPTPRSPRSRSGRRRRRR